MHTRKAGVSLAVHTLREGHQGTSGAVNIPEEVEVAVASFCSHWSLLINTDSWNRARLGLSQPDQGKGFVSVLLDTRSVT